MVTYHYRVINHPYSPDGKLIRSDGEWRYITPLNYAFLKSCGHDDDTIYRLAAIPPNDIIR